MSRGSAGTPCPTLDTFDCETGLLEGAVFGELEFGSDAGAGGARRGPGGGVLQLAAQFRDLIHLARAAEARGGGAALVVRLRRLHGVEGLEGGFQRGHFGGCHSGEVSVFEVVDDHLRAG